MEGTPFNPHHKSGNVVVIVPTVSIARAMMRRFQTINKFMTPETFTMITNLIDYDEDRFTHDYEEITMDLRKSGHGVTTAAMKWNIYICHAGDWCIDQLVINHDLSDMAKTNVANYMAIIVHGDTPVSKRCAVNLASKLANSTMMVMYRTLDTDIIRDIHNVVFCDPSWTVDCLPHIVACYNTGGISGYEKITNYQTGEVSPNYTHLRVGEFM